MDSPFLHQTSVIVCTVDRFDDLEKCLESLRPFKSSVAEIIVVNNGPHSTAVMDIGRRYDAAVVARPNVVSVGRATPEFARQAEAFWHSSMTTRWRTRTGFRPAGAVPRSPSAGGGGEHLAQTLSTPLAKLSIFSIALSFRNRN